MDPILGEIRPFAFDYPPIDWMQCNGQTLQISQFTALFTILGITYGGDGQKTFKLPNLNGILANTVAAVPIGMGQLNYGPNGPHGSTYVIGTTGGTANAPLDNSQTPAHTHSFSGLLASTATPSTVPAANSYLTNYILQTAAPTSIRGYQHAATSPNPNINLNSATIAPTGVVGLPPTHPNLAPNLTMNYCICVNGTYPIFQE